MKLAITGKGGTGKTTIAGMLAHCYNNDGYQVLAVDADADANLASAIGIPYEQAMSIVPISAQRELIKEKTGANPRHFGQLFKMNPTVSDIPDKFCIDFREIRLLVMGAVRKGGSGCACPENVLLKSLLSEILLRRKEVVIVDMEAGVEHLGRATAEAIDKMLIIVEPGTRSIHTAKLIMKFARDIGVRRFGIIGNKIQTERQNTLIREQLPSNLILGMISYHDIICDADLFGKPLFELMDDNLKTEFNDIYQSINPN